MSVPKGRRSVSPIQYFESAYTIVENITKFLISDFGTKKTYNNLYVFTHKAKMEQEDRDNFKEFVEKISSRYRDSIFNISIPKGITPLGTLLTFK